ncbi:unnamed protein product [Schistocephalus solidus]|uniref:Uncharacterized protein n=1 Tax=Schistocephalus solidus TaxID=70667 RepID=A0A183T4K3_SCHSO|nr:unnamed protein product [Schistocephalus solidus]
MLLFEGEPLLFILFSLSTLSFLIGGCSWGAGEEAGEEGRRIAGIIVFFFGVGCCVLFIILFTYKKIRKKAKAKKDFEELMRMQNEFADNAAYQPEEHEQLPQQQEAKVPVI